MTIVIPVSPDATRQAASCLRDGGLVAIPTETVYGLAADATNGPAVAHIFEAKGRPRFNPLICHVDSFAMAAAIVTFDPVAERLATAFWPGALTLVLPARSGSDIHPLVSGGLPTLAVRSPRGIALDLIAELGRPVAAPSANPSGRVSPTTAEHVRRGLDGRIDMILDGGPCPMGLESTIVKPAGDHLLLLRAGAVAVEDIEAAAGLPVVRVAPGAAVQAPGQLASHYAPAGLVRLDVQFVEPGEHLIAFGPDPIEGQDAAAAVINLSPTGDLREAAATLFSALTAFDRPEVIRIAVAPVPSHGLGEAINDRLHRAAAPRDSR
ncbi:L-threonylcarbamoyladenylate synthase [Consotaella aegiceratis]|uniref:L-threonylcarbamoyladenylate synthase n=1 Tax=Consotaella aegiceratis TaxID=3097961 RepID=UPI002F42DCCF